ncbi:MAG: acetyl-CoA carboxylase biotin carboxylase subunit, partial [Pseudomonadota bacterium]
MFRKVLIANRGEIAVRVAKTARRLGIETVAVFSDADAQSPHVSACDEAVRIGPPAAKESYLVADKIIEAAQRTGAQAIHPGYGFLSENALFSEALEAAGITFVGPTADTIRAMGSKSAAKDLMEEAGVPTTPGYQGKDQSIAVFSTEAARIGYPVLLKATAGGGGKGMRRVDEPASLEEAMLSAQREGASSFGDDRLLIEKYIETARHVEVQIFGDGRGEVVHLFERDCSVQRRHQKIIEEAPAPHLPTEVRERLLNAGVQAGKAVHYRGAGTVEFLYDGAEDVYFMEMNTRLQVEHPVTEAITGVDLVEWQLRVAAGEPIPLTQERILECGHSVEARVYAENPAAEFAPSIGTLTNVQMPHGANIRVDAGVAQGGAVSPYYDPMIAKVITAGDNREAAFATMSHALDGTRIDGVDTNVAFLKTLVDHPSMRAGDVSTNFLDDHARDLRINQTASDFAIAAAVFALELDCKQTMAGAAESVFGFRLNAPATTLFWLEIDGQLAACRLTHAGDQGSEKTLKIEYGTSAAALKSGSDEQSARQLSFQGTVEGGTAGGDSVRIEIEGLSKVAVVSSNGGHSRVFIDGQTTDFKRVSPLEGGASSSAEGSLNAPMPGVITALAVDVGTSVSPGDVLVVMEAMTMEHTIKAPAAG